MNFGYFWLFWRIFFGYTGIPLYPWPTLERGNREKKTFVYLAHAIIKKSRKPCDVLQRFRAKLNELNVEASCLVNVFNLSALNCCKWSVREFRT